jgi:hypothetical protein
MDEWQRESLARIGHPVFQEMFQKQCKHQRDIFDDTFKTLSKPPNALWVIAILRPSPVNLLSSVLLPAIFEHFNAMLLQNGSPISRDNVWSRVLSAK